MSEFADERMKHVDIVVAIDPGVSGAIACLYEGKIDIIDDMPLGNLYGKTKKVWLPELVSMVNRMDPDIIVVEKVNPTEQQGAARAGSFMISFAFALAVGQVLGVPTFTISPMEWKAYHGLSKTKKAQSVKKARDVFKEDQPDVVKEEFKSLTADHDKAEACLIAKYFWDIKRYTRSMEDKLW